jgi:hypothetical protein
VCYRCGACAGVLQFETSEKQQRPVTCVSRVSSRLLFLIRLSESVAGDGIRVLGRGPFVGYLLQSSSSSGPLGMNTDEGLNRTRQC